jgi:hemerythrin-like domain-containing protein
MYHHPREDLVFEILRRRAPELIEIVDELTRQHRQLTDTATALLDALAVFPGSAVMPREGLVALLRDYVALLRRHMDIEEGQVFPRAKAVLSETDWEQVASGSGIEQDPLFGNTIGARYQSLYQTIMSESDGQVRSG